MIPTESLKFTEARPKLSELLDKVFRREMRIRLHKGSIPVAAIVSIRDLERLEELDRQRAERFAALELIGEKFADVQDDELEVQIAKAIAAVRAEQKAAAPVR
jgi:prevent-host-death family protein